MDLSDFPRSMYRVISFLRWLLEPAMLVVRWLISGAPPDYHDHIMRQAVPLPTARLKRDIAMEEFSHRVRNHARFMGEKFSLGVGPLKLA